MTLLPVKDALRRLLAEAQTLDSENIELSGAAGRTLAEPVIAMRTQPPFAASAMDGYAVRSEDIAQAPVELTIIGQAPAGYHFEGRVGPKQTVRIFTGAPVPEGADAVLIQENTEPAGNERIRALKIVEAGQHIRPAGLDFREGETLLQPGRVLDAAALSLAAAANHARLTVVRRPRVAILATGDELLAPGSPPGPGQIIASNSYGVAAIASAAGAGIRDLGIVPDDKSAIAGAVSDALKAEADVIVTLGGASVGDHDLVREVLEESGMTLSFWKIAMRPGKPLMVGRLSGVHVLGLPGNPVSSLVCSHLFLLPLLARLSGRDYRADIRTAILETDLPQNDEREDYVRAVITYSEEQLVARPFDRQDSSMLKVLAAANGLIVRQPFAPAAEKGDACSVLMLRAPA